MKKEKGENAEITLFQYFPYLENEIKLIPPER